MVLVKSTVVTVLLFILQRSCTVNGIWNGWTATSCQFPYYALIGYIDEQKDLNWVCSGAIIQPPFVITSASCLQNLTNFVIRVCTSENVDTTQLRALPPYIYEAKPGQEPHYAEGYVPGQFNNDLALLETKNQIGFSDCVQPAILPKTYQPSIDIPNINLDLLVTGWEEDKGPNFYHPRYLTMQETNKSECLEHFPDANMTTTLCVRGIGYDGFDRGSLCNDKGAPLVLKQDNRTLVGIYSPSTLKCDTGGPEAFVNIQQHLDWINARIDTSELSLE